MQVNISTLLDYINRNLHCHEDLPIGENAVFRIYHKELSFPPAPAISVNRKLRFKVNLWNEYRVLKVLLLFSGRFLKALMGFGIKDFYVIITFLVRLATGIRLLIFAKERLSCIVITCFRGCVLVFWAESYLLKDFRYSRSFLGQGSLLPIIAEELRDWGMDITALKDGSKVMILRESKLLFLRQIDWLERLGKTREESLALVILLPLCRLHAAILLTLVI